MSRVSDLNNSLIDDKEVFTLYRYRYWIGIIFIVATNLNIVSFALFGSLQSTLVNVYDEELTYVNFATLLIFNVTFIPSSFVANYIIDTYGLKPGFLIGNILNLIGLWVRCLSKHSFGWIFAGQCFMGIAQPFFGIAPQKVSSVWFGPSERTVATTVFVCCSLIGNAVGGIAPQWFVDITADNETILNQLQTMFFYLAIFCSVCYIFIIPPMRGKPPTPPSKAAAATKYNYVNSLKSLLKNKNAMMMIVATAVVNGTTTNYASTIQQTVLPFGINGYQVADVMSIALLVTPVGYFIGAAFVAKYKKYNLATIVIAFSSLAFLILNFIAATTGNIYFYGATAILYGVNVAPNGPIALEYGMELAFPVAEATLGAVWSLTNQISCTAESLIVDSILGKNPTSRDSKTAFIIIAGYQGVMILLLFFVKERLKRTEFESKNQDYKEVKDEINP